jgi:hypothetical protein
MTDSLSSLLIVRLQDAGICSDDFQTISRIVCDALYDINKLVLPGERITFPNGDHYTKLGA